MSNTAENVTTKEVVSTTLNQDIAALDTTFDRTSTKLDALANKLEPVIMDMAISGEDKPSQIEAKVGLINALRGVYSDINKQAKERVSVKQKQKESETNEATATIVTSILNQIRTTTPSGQQATVSQSDASASLDKIVSEKGITFGPGEKKERSDDLSVDVKEKK